MFHRYKTPKYYLALSADDLAMVKGILLWWRNKLIREGKPTEDVDELILKLVSGTNKEMTLDCPNGQFIIIQFMRLQTEVNRFIKLPIWLFHTFCFSRFTIIFAKVYIDSWRKTNADVIFDFCPYS